MKIGELAKQTGIATSRIRFYERHGLLPKATRRDNGYRDYGHDMVERLRIIGLSQSLGFSLSEIREILPSAIEEQLSCDRIIDELGKKRENVQLHITKLKKLSHRIDAAIEYFHDVKSAGDKAKTDVLMKL